MSAGLNALLSGVVDYAGLFPPAKLPLDESLRNYARYRQEPDAWMLGRFILPVARLSELAPYLNELCSPQSPLPLSVLGRGGENAVAFRETLLDDAMAIRAFLRSHPGTVTIDVIETRLPVVENVGDCFPKISEPLSFFYEISLTADIPAACAAIKAAVGGVKVRCGGLEAKAFPTVEQVAFVLHTCQKVGVAIKFTAGLHHPIRRFNAGVQTHMHGFVNVLVAGLLSEQGADEAMLCAVLSDESPASFVIDDTAIRWKSQRIPLDRITSGRMRLTSFGSCSFDEPREDLRALGWLA